VLRPVKEISRRHLPCEGAANRDMKLGKVCESEPRSLAVSSGPQAGPFSQEKSER
jgi:hypothetical protein